MALSNAVRAGDLLADACALIAFYAPEGRMSAGTVWEIERKVGLGKLPLPVQPGFKGRFTDLLREEGYLLAHLTWEDAALAATLPPHHQDPMDRMLIATALRWT